MATLVIDGIDDDLMARLETEAAAEARTVQDVARDILARELPSRLSLSERLRRIRAMTPPGPQEDSTHIIRVMRDRGWQDG